jgi:hypothetical protein
LRVGTMKNRAHAVQSDPNPRALPLADLSAAGDEQTLDIPPRDAGADRLGEDRLKRRPMFPAQLHNSITI